MYFGHLPLGQLSLGQLSFGQLSFGQLSFDRQSTCGQSICGQVVRHGGGEQGVGSHLMTYGIVPHCSITKVGLTEVVLQEYYWRLLVVSTNCLSRELIGEQMARNSLQIIKFVYLAKRFGFDSLWHKAQSSLLSG